MTKKELILEYLRNNKQRVIISALCVWSFLHTFILLRFIRVITIQLIISYSSVVVTPYEKFYPFTFIDYTRGDCKEEFISRNFDMRFYDFSEYFFYVAGAWMIYYLYRYLTTTSIAPKSI